VALEIPRNVILLVVVGDNLLLVGYYQFADFNGLWLDNPSFSGHFRTNEK